VPAWAIAVFSTESWILRSGAPWRELPDDFRPYTDFLQPLRSRASSGRLEADHKDIGGCVCLVAPIACYIAFGVDLDFDAPGIGFDRGEHMIARLLRFPFLPRMIALRKLANGSAEDRRPFTPFCCHLQ
jgi:hypothetical protein